MHPMQLFRTVLFYLLDDTQHEESDVDCFTHGQRMRHYGIENEFDEQRYGI